MQIFLIYTSKTVTNCRKCLQLNKIEQDLKVKDSKWTAANDCTSNQIKLLEKENDHLKKEIYQLKKEIYKLKKEKSSVSFVI